MVAAKLELKDVQPGAVFEAVFEDNTDEKNPKFLFVARKLDGRVAPKVVLSKDPRIQPGRQCLARVVRIDKPKSRQFGYIEVELVRALDFELPDVYLDPVVSRKLQVLLESGLNILLDGPQGCGKTVLAKAIAEGLGYEFVFFNCSAVTEPTDFMSTLSATLDAKGGIRYTLVPTVILDALQEALAHRKRRYLVFLDEFNRCPESARNVLMPALDATRRIFNPIANEFTPIPDNVQFIAAVNRGDEFSGTFGIDAAQLDRFAPLAMSYLPEDDEIKLLSKRYPELGATLIRSVVRIASAIRESAELGSGLSVRATDEVCVYLSHPAFSEERLRMLPEILKDSFCGRFSGRWNDSSSDAGAAWGIIGMKLKELTKGKKDKQ